MRLRCQPDAEPIPGHWLIAPLGAGGFGEVWKCRGPDGELRALKVVHGDLAAADPGRRTGEQELHGLRKVAGLRHPALLTPERFDVCDGQLLILMELAEGSVWDRFHACRAANLPGIPRDELLGYLVHVADGLDTLREAQLQHLDVKPQNLLVVNGQAKIGDFGLVRDLRSGRPGAGASPAYSAPETLAAKLSPHCDQYSLAIVYQELLTGARPFAGTTAEQLTDQHLTAAPNLAPLPPADRSAVRRALAKKPNHRFPSCAAFLRALREPGSEAVTANVDRQSAIHSSGTTIRPTVVVALGSRAEAVARRLRRELQDLPGPRDVSPFRLLYVDTDAEAVATAPEDGSLDAAEILPARLQRPAHYAKLRTAGKKSAPNGWFDPAWLKRLGESESPDGCRGLGRLAFADHSAVIAQKLEADLGAASRAAPGWPRVVVVADMADGAGGMLYDLAYLARRLLRRFGDVVDVSGWLLVPQADSDDDGALANTFAALAELRHFNKPETTYRTSYGEAGETLSAKEPPFDDVVVLPDVETAAAGLLRDLRSPGNHLAGEVRTFGEVGYVWPRRAIVRQAARRLANELVGQWIETDSTVLTEPLAKWVAEQWSGLELGPEALARRLRQAAAAATDGLTPALAAAAEALAGEWGTRVARLPATLIEQPGFRLAGAETAVRLLSEYVKQLVARSGAAADESIEKASEARTADPAAALRWQCQSMILRQVVAVYAAVLGRLAEMLTEIGICRQRLVAVAERLGAEGSPAAADVKLLLPSGCATIAGAAETAAAIADGLADLDRQTQEHLAETSGGLARACLTNRELPATLGPALTGLGESLLTPQVCDRAAELFLVRHPDPVAAFKELWTKAAPALGPSGEATAVFAPLALAEAARQAFGPDVSFAPTADEIAVVRGSPMPLTSLRHFGPVAKAAYQRRKSAGDSPHSRVDVPFNVD
jgi:hypothetical protein